MKKVILALAVSAALVFAAAALASSVVVVDPTGSAFTGTYSCGTNPDGTPCTATQNGYVSVSTDNSNGPEVQACNGNPSYTNPQDGKPIQGYVYLSPSGSGPAVPDYGTNVVGATNGNNDGTSAPCPQNPSGSGVTP